jgi:hypothetical protein
MNAFKNSWRRSVIKEVGRSWNELRFLAADKTEVERTHRQPMLLEGTMDFIIIIIIIIDGSSQILTIPVKK